MELTEVIKIIDERIKMKDIQQKRCRDQLLELKYSSQKLALHKLKGELMTYLSTDEKTRYHLGNSPYF